MTTTTTTTAAMFCKISNLSEVASIHHLTKPTLRRAAPRRVLTEQISAATK